MDISIPFWLLVFSYWLHLLATVVWLGGLALLALIAWPAWQRQQLAGNQWPELQRRFVPWVNGSLVVLLLTGFLQMTADPNYEGFLNFDSLWSQAILLKHIAFLGMVGITVYLQGWLYPALKRLALLAAQRPDLAQVEQAQLARQEVRLLRLNLVCAALVLFFTAVATAI
jgi:uncharacterized membrane protein